MTQQQLAMPGFPRGRTGAVFSPCRKYRYVLWRQWEPAGKLVAWVGLNPSTADELDDDATITRCIGYSQRWGYAGLFMLNLFAFRATQPADMFAAADPVGPENDASIGTYAGLADLVVAAWGWNAHGHQRVEIVVNSFAMVGVPMHCLGRTRDGDPKHPVRLPYSVQLEPYP